MTTKELYAKLKGIGLPITYGHYDKPPKLPYMVYMDAGTENVSSDKKVHGQWLGFAIELYTAKKDMATEKKIEDVLKAIDVDYTSSGAIYIIDEKIYMNRYEITLLKKENE